MAEYPEDPTVGLPCAHGGPSLRGVLRASPEDFQVSELLGYQPSGEGEHAFLVVRKRGQNTMDVARALARFSGVRQMAVGFAGLKDRQAVTTQSFSIHLPGQPDPDWQALDLPGVEVLSAVRHHRKIRRGSLQGNRFELTLRAISGDKAQAEQQLQLIQSLGVPNYFGAQRFGRAASNLVRVDAHFRGEGRRLKPEQRRMLYSAARSYLFNAVLAARVKDANWNQLLDGDVALLAGSGRQFQVDAVDDALRMRLSAFDIHPSGPLPGQASRSLTSVGAARYVEEAALAGLLQSNWVEELAAQRVDADRRALRLQAQHLSWEWLEDDVLVLRFELTAGSYATALVRELCATEFA